MRQRLNIEGLLLAQRGTGREMDVLSDILDKIETPEAERVKLFIEVPFGGGQRADEQAIDAAPDFTVELEKEEVRRLTELLNTWTQFNPRDRKWRQPLLQALAA